MVDDRLTHIKGLENSEGKSKGWNYFKIIAQLKRREEKIRAWVNYILG
jgi:hypothetical protein